MRPSDARALWRDTPARGTCLVCGRDRIRLIRHHVVIEQVVTREAGKRFRWCVENRLLICKRCHDRHHGGGGGRISLSKIPADAIGWARRVLGRAVADDYFRRRYRP